MRRGGFGCVQIFLQGVGAILPQHEGFPHGGGVLLEAEHVLLQQPHTLARCQMRPGGGAKQDKQRGRQRLRDRQHEMQSAEGGGDGSTVERESAGREQQTGRSAEGQEAPGDESRDDDGETPASDGADPAEPVAGEQVVEEMKVRGHAVDGLPGRQQPGCRDGGLRQDGHDVAFEPSVEGGGIVLLEGVPYRRQRDGRQVG